MYICAYMNNVQNESTRYGTMGSRPIQDFRSPHVDPVHETWGRCGSFGPQFLSEKMGCPKHARYKSATLGQISLCQGIWP